MIVWSLVVLSLMLTAVTFFPNLSTATLATGIGVGVTLGLAGAAIIFAVGWRTERSNTEDTVPFGALDFDQVEELEELPKLTRAELKAFH
jgi:hypothetical protein